MQFTGTWKIVAKTVNTLDRDSGIVRIITNEDDSYSAFISGAK